MLSYKTVKIIAKLNNSIKKKTITSISINNFHIDVCSIKINENLKKELIEIDNNDHA
jgi:hypothetical protein